MIERHMARALGDAGDTLIELLVAMTIIGLTVAGLLGGLVTDLATSGDHRNQTNLDGIIQSIAEAARQQIQLASTGAQYTPCLPGAAANNYKPASPPSYRFLSAPYPATAPAGTAVTVFGTGLSTITTVSVNGTPIPAFSATVTNATYGNVTVTFTMPAGASGTIKLTDVNGNSATTPVPFSSLATGSGTVVNPSPLQNYSVGITGIQYWNGTTFSSSCTPTAGYAADLQQITIGGTTTGAADQLTIVVADPSPFRAASQVTETYTGPASPSFGSSMLTFSAPVSIQANEPYGGTTPPFTSPTGSVSWAIVPPNTVQPDATCPTSPLTGGTPTCTFRAKEAGQYRVFAIYSGDGNYLISSGSATSASVPKGSSTTSVAGTSNGLPLLPTLTFTATVTGAGVTPSGTVTWTVTDNGVTMSPNPCAQPSTLNSSGQTTCTITAATPGSYVATADYGGDANYTGSTASGTVSAPFLAASISLSDAVSTSGQTTNLKITATVAGPAGDPTPTGSVTWSAGLCTSATTSLQNGTATCTIKNPTAGAAHTGTVTYNGDTTYGPTAPTAVLIPAATSTTSGSGTATLTFNLTVTGPAGDPTPANVVTWQPKAGATIISCSSTTYTPGTNSATYQCVVNGAVSGTNYTATATYGSDPNYLPPYPNPISFGPVNG